jgi:predicted dienelactone hydrolase
VVKLALLVLLALVLPAGAARFPVGVTTMTFTKASATTGAPRPLDTVVWYPAERRGGTPETFGRRDAPVRHGKFPLIVFSHGTCGLPTEASYWTMALAREGFVVAAPAHIGNTANDVPGCLGGPAFIDSAVNREPDVVFVIDSMLGEDARTGSPFKRRLRRDAIGVTGLSFGGFTTLLTALLEPRIVAAVSLVTGGTAALGTRQISIPTMVIGSERDQVVGFAESQAAYAKLVGPRFLVELLGANHLSVVDSCKNGLGGLNLCVPGDIPQEDAHALVLHYGLPFFRRYLSNKRTAGRTLTKQVDGVILTSDPTP